MGVHRMRKNKDEWLMSIAEMVAEQSTCIVMKIGAVIAKERRILSTGYNGSLPSSSHCDTLYFYDRNQHHEWSHYHEVHAEANAISFAAKMGIALEGTSIYITRSPCLVCSKLIIQSGISKVYYNIEYDRERSIEKLMDNNVEVIKI